MFKVKLLQPEIDYETRRVIARQEIIEGNYREFFDVADKEKEFDISIRRHRQRRSLDSNAYWHVLIGKIADKLGASNAEIKNKMLAQYGQLELDENGKTVFMIVRDDIPVEKWQEIHLRPTSQIQELNGITYRVYMTVRGSHTYDSREFSTLINGTISEAVEIGIPEAEIISPREKEMLREKYGIEVA